MKLAVVGSGVSGLSAAWLLAKRHDVTLFEKQGRFGGHSNTLNLRLDGKTVPVDTGFIVFNRASYPNLVALLDHLGVETDFTDMSFAVSSGDGAYEYSGSGLPGLFGQLSNILNPRHYLMLRDLNRFFGNALPDSRKPAWQDATLGGYLTGNGYSQAFIDDHILPMTSAIWSSSPGEAMRMPFVSFARFFDNHGLLQALNRPLWHTVRGGSQVYVEKLLRQIGDKAFTRRGAAKITRHAGNVEIRDADGDTERFDQVVIAAHADEALGLLADPDAEENRLLGKFRYSRNAAVLHEDRNLMPTRRRVWAAWNFMARERKHSGTPCISYWMNMLQQLDTERQLFVTLNPDRPIAPRRAHASFSYHHPLFNPEALKAQTQLWSLQGRRRTWFCGSYFGYGFHEDGLQSGLAVAEQLGGVARPWQVENANGRIHLQPVQTPAPMLEAAE